MCIAMNRVIPFQLYQFKSAAYQLALINTLISCNEIKFRYSQTNLQVTASRCVLSLQRRSSTQASLASRRLATRLGQSSRIGVDLAQFYRISFAVNHAIRRRWGGDTCIVSCYRTFAQLRWRCVGGQPQIVLMAISGDLMHFSCPEGAAWF